MEAKKLSLKLLSGKYGVFHLAKQDPIPSWLHEINFVSITRTDDELSIICPQEKIPGGVLIDTDWHIFKVQGPFGFEVSGVVAAVTKPLADAGISILNVSTYETDYLLVREEDLELAKKILNQFHCLD